MGWADCGDDSKGRPIGYGFTATCDYPGCDNEIDRGLSYACGGMHGDGNYSGGDESVEWQDISCEYLCPPQLCVSCNEQLEKDYREDPDWRDQWPTDALPLQNGAMMRDQTEADIIRWLENNSIYDSACSYLSDEIGYITDETGDEIDWLEVTRTIAKAIRKGDY